MYTHLTVTVLTFPFTGVQPNVVGLPRRSLPLHSRERETERRPLASKARMTHCTKAGKSESHTIAAFSHNILMTFARRRTTSAAPRAERELLQFPSFFGAPAMMFA